MPLTNPFLQIGFPLLLLAITLGTNIGLFVHLANRVNAIDDKLGGKIEDLRDRMDVRFETLTSKVVEIDNRVSRIADKLGIVPR